MTKKQEKERFEHLSQVHALIQVNRPEAIEGKEGPREACVFAKVAPCCGAPMVPAPEHGPGFSKAACDCGEHDSEA